MDGFVLIALNGLALGEYTAVRRHVRGNFMQSPAGAGTWQRA